MSLKDRPDSELLSEVDVLKRIEAALEGKRKFSLIRIGDGENFVLAQGHLMTDEQLLNTYWAREIKSKKKGITLPCYELRDRIVKLIPHADIVGVCRNNNDEVLTHSKFKRAFTNRIFDYYNLDPPNICYVFVNRKMVSHRRFWKMLHNYRTLLISRWAKPYAEIITKQYAKLKPKIAGCIEFTHYNEISDTLKKVGKYRFDLALISAGVNALILAPKIAQLYGKVALDFGKVMMYTVTSRDLISPWHPKH